LVAVLIAAVLSAWYLATLFVAKFELHVLASCIANESDGGSKSCSTDPESIAVDDARLLSTPKLREALIKAPLATPDESGGRWYDTTLSGLEFDAMNKMLVSTEKGQEILKNSLYTNPNQVLWPNPSNIVSVSYGGNSYQLIVLTYPFAFRVDSGSLGESLFFFVLPLATAIMGALIVFYAVIMNRRAVISEGASVLIFVAGGTIFLFSSWFLGLFSPLFS